MIQRPKLHHAKYSFLISLGCLVVGTAFFLTANAPTKLWAQSTLTVTAKVDAPLPTSPALITSPSDQQHFNTATITVSGTCGDGVYIILYRNNQASGTAACLGGTFSLQASLFVGSNQLTAKVFNGTDNEGPPGNVITVFYDPPSPGPLPHIDASRGLQVIAVDGVTFISGRLFKTSSTPTIQGYAPAFSKVTITYSPRGVTCVVFADARGAWTCKLHSRLPGGTQQVTVESVSPQGVHSHLIPFSISVMGDTSNIPGVSTDLFIIYSPEPYRVYAPGERWQGTAAIYGGTAPYTTRVEWGDERSSSFSPASSNPFLIDHTYQQAGHYRPIIYVVDTAQNKASLQLFVPVVNKEGQDVRAGTADILPIIIVTVIIMILFAISVADLAVLARTLHFKRSQRK